MTIAEKLVRAKADLDDVFSNGRLYGYGDGMTEGIELGKQQAYDEFWDSFQDNGNRANYQGAFYGRGWNNDTFKPKYDIRPTTIHSLFSLSSVSGDFVELCNNLNIEFDTSKCTTLYAAFNSAYYITRVGVIDGRGITTTSGFNYTFQYAQSLHTIDKIIVGENQNFNACFYGTKVLKNISFEGTIKNSIDFSYCPLTVASVVNVLQHLQGFSAGDAGFQKYTLTFSTTTKALLDEVQANDPNGYIPELMDDWRTYITMLGWNIG